MKRDMAQLYQQYTLSPSLENHVKLAHPVFQRMTDRPITATMKHVPKLEGEQIGVYLPIPHTCKVLQMGDTDRMLTTMGHELGHAYHRTFLHNQWEETQTELFELWYTRTLEDMLYRPFARYIGEESVLFPHIDYLFTCNAEKLKRMHDDFDHTVQELALPLRKPINYKLGF